MNLTDRLLAGALAGFAATGPMSAAMGAMKQLLPWWEQYPLPPHQITMDIAKKAGVRKKMGRRSRETATAAGHFGYGAATGAIYGLLAPDMPGPPIVKGILYALGVWTVSYLGWLPLAGIYKPATEYPARRNVLMVLAHVVWGTGMGLLFNGLSRRR